MPREITPDDAHSIAPDIAGDAGLSVLAGDGAAEASLASTAFARGPNDAAVLPPLDHAAVRTIIAGIMLAMFLSALEQTIVAPALPAIGRSLANLDDLSWIVTAYLIAATAVTPLFGKLSDIHGRRTIMLLSIGIFIVGSLACALASNIWVLVFGRILQGIGGGGLLPIAQTIIADLLTPRERPIAQSYTSVVFMSASVLGPVLGGLLTDYLHWSFIFWINLPLGAIALVMTARALRRLPRHDRPHQLDIPGVTLMVGGVGGLVAGARLGRHALPVAVLADRLSSRRRRGAVGAVRGTASHRARAVNSAGHPARPNHQRDHRRGVFQHRHHHRRDDLHPALLPDGVRRLGEFFRLRVDRVHGRCGSRLHGHGAADGSVDPLYAPSDHRARRSRSLPSLCLRAETKSLSLVEFTLLIGVLGLSIGPMYQTSTIVTQNAVKPHQLGTATGSLNFFRLLGGAVIVAVFGAIVLGSTGGGSAVITLEKLAAGHADFAPGFRLVFIAGAIFLAIALGALLLVEERPLHGPVRLTDPAAE